MAFAKPSLKGRALRLLSRREHSRAELERKLAPHEEEPGQLRQALDELQARGFIDEGRVVESVLHRRAPRLGAGRLKQELVAKGLDAARVAAAVATLRGTELQRAREVWRRRFGSPPASMAERARQARFLAARGFDGDVIRRVLATAGGDEGAD
jgi:regulatory protein